MFSACHRSTLKKIIAQHHFDVLVIGGGITGAGIALDAVTRGLSVALVDMQDFSAGTSSRSTKLVHGGLRYLKQLQVKIVAETGKERDIVYRNALHVTTPERMLLPFYKGGTFGKLTTSAGLFTYDLLAGVKKEERREMISAAETLALEPLLKKDGLLGGGHYVEYRTDDARLTIETIKKAVEEGAICLNYMKVEEFRYHNRKIVGAIAKDTLVEDTIEISATVVVNATGPWVDEVRGKDHAIGKKQLRLTKGVHIVIDQQRFPLRQAIYFDAPDGRMIFAIPRDGKAYVGTTDTFYEDDPMTPTATEDDVTYLLHTVNEMFPGRSLTTKDVESTWAGVRPLIYEEGKSASEISRKDEIWESESGLLTIAGGKLTGYRKMAEDVVDRVVKSFPKKSSGPCITEQLRLSGGAFIDEGHAQQFFDRKAAEAPLFGLSQEEGHSLASFYGTNVDLLFMLAKTGQGKTYGIPQKLYAQILYAIHYEMAATPADIFTRRLGTMYFQISEVKQYADGVLSLMATILNYTEQKKQQHKLELMEQIRAAEVGGGASYAGI